MVRREILRHINTISFHGRNDSRQRAEQYKRHRLPKHHRIKDKGRQQDAGLAADDLRHDRNQPRIKAETGNHAESGNGRRLQHNRGEHQRPPRAKRSEDRQFAAALVH